MFFFYSRDFAKIVFELFTKNNNKVEIHTHIHKPLIYFCFCFVFFFACVCVCIYVCKWETSLTRSHKNFLIEKFLRCCCSRCVIVYYPGVRLQFVLFRSRRAEELLTIKQQPIQRNLALCYCCWCCISWSSSSFSRWLFQ